MVKFHVWSNNGVVAVIPEDVFRERRYRRDIEGEAKKHGQELRLPPARPVFIFSDTESLGLGDWLTGTIADMELLLEGHEVFRDHPFYVPFSNGDGWRTDDFTRGDKFIEREMECGYRTTLRQVIDAFLVPKHLIEAVR